MQVEQEFNDPHHRIVTEYSVLQYLAAFSIPGIVRMHGLCSDKNTRGLVLDCYLPHDFSPQYTHLRSLVDVVNAQSLSEDAATTLFYRMLDIVHAMHDKNVVHCDLRLDNFWLNIQTGELQLVNFDLAKVLRDADGLRVDHWAPPSHASPELISNKPYAAKPNDMWAMGVMYFNLLFRRYPFWEKALSQLYRKIASGQYIIPKPIRGSTASVIRGLLECDPTKRLTALQARFQLGSMSIPKELQAVPSMDVNTDVRVLTRKELVNVLHLSRDGPPGSMQSYLRNL